MTTRQELRLQVVSCQACDLAPGSTTPIPWKGPDAPRVVVVGEDTTNGKDRAPITGPAWELLEDALGTHDDYTYMNTVSCYGGPALEWGHVEACTPNRVGQLNFLDPTFVLLLGNAAVKAWHRDINVKHGARVFCADERIFFYTYHPATVLKIPRLDTAFRVDLERFLELAAGDPEDVQHLVKFIPDNCCCCNDWACWWHTDMLGYCEQHLPDHVRPDYVARMALVGRPVG